MRCLYKKKPENHVRIRPHPSASRLLGNEVDGGPALGVQNFTNSVAAYTLLATEGSLAHYEFAPAGGRPPVEASLRSLERMAPGAKHLDPARRNTNG